MFCRNCGKELSEESTYCLYCGVRQKDSYCKNCGKELPSEAVFCPCCGSKQKEDTFWDSIIKLFVSLFKTHEHENNNNRENKEENKNLLTDESSGKALFCKSEIITSDKDNKELEDHTNTTENKFDNSDKHLDEKIVPDEANIHDANTISIGRKCTDESVNQCENEPSENTKPRNEGNAINDKEIQLLEDNSIVSERIIEISSHEADKEIKYNYDKMPLLHRFCGSIIDKFIIIILFVIVNISIDPYKSAGDIGIYMAMLRTTPTNYEYIDKANINGSNGISNLYGETPYIGQTRDFDIKMTILFFVVYLLYYFVFEITIKSSVGKRFLGGFLRLNQEEAIDQFGVFSRIVVRVILIFFIVGVLHFELELSHVTTFGLFLLAIDCPIFLTHRSLVDLLTGTIYMEKGDPTTLTELNNYVNEFNTSPAESNNYEGNNGQEENIVDGYEKNSEEESNGNNSPFSTRKWYNIIVIGLICLGVLAFIYYKSSNNHDNNLCPELLEAAHQMNSEAPFLIADGMEIVHVTYVDTVYTLLYQVDGDIIPFDKIDEFQKEHKRGILASIQVSIGKDRENYKKFVEYHVTKVDKFLNKETGDAVTIVTSPKEIEAALNEPLSDIARLKQYIDTQKKLLPTEIDEGFVLKDIEIVDDRVAMSISVDEDIYDFRVVADLKDNLKDDMANQLRTNPVLQRFCQLLVDTGYGLTIRYYGNQSYLETFLQFTVENIINIRNGL